MSQNGYGVFGQAIQQKNGAAFIDPLSSVAYVGQRILEYSFGFLTNLTQNLYMLSNTTMIVTGSIQLTALLLSPIGAMGGYTGAGITLLQNAIVTIVEIVMKMLVLATFMYLPVVAAITLMFITIGLLLGFAYIFTFFYITCRALLAGLLP